MKHRPLFSTSRRRLVVSLAASSLTVVTAAVAQWVPRVTKLPKRCTIGPFAYRTDAVSGVATAISDPILPLPDNPALRQATAPNPTGSRSDAPGLTQPSVSIVRRSPMCLAAGCLTPSSPGVLVPSPSAAATDVRSAQFLFPARVAMVDHVRVSEMSLVVRSDGVWTLTALAEQNPLFVSEELRPRFERYHRNAVFLSARMAGGPYVSEAGTTVQRIAQGTLVAIQLPAFVLERGESRRIVQSGTDPSLATQFDRLRQAAVDLSYQTDGRDRLVPDGTTLPFGAPAGSPVTPGVALPAAIPRGAGF